MILNEEEHICLQSFKFNEAEHKDPKPVWDHFTESMDSTST